MAGCSIVDVNRLAGDGTGGRNNGTPGSTKARAVPDRATQADRRRTQRGGTGDAAYLQAINGGTNVVAVIPGTDLADEYVMVGAHYDHLGSSCRTAVAGDTICNGATDNAAGVAATLAIGRAIAAQSKPPRRSVILAFWDREEDGLLGSQFYTQNPLVPLADTVGYVNFDIQGANLLPSLRNTTFAVAAETGGARLKELVRSAAGAGTLDTTMLELDLRSVPQRLHQLHQRATCRRSSSPTRPVPAITRPRTSPASSTSGSSESRSPRRWR